MRPVERGPWPTDAQGAEIQFANYQDARPELLKRLGYYCSYCEMNISNSSSVEHVQPKSFARGLERDWYNFLLACTYCQGCKIDTPVSLSDHFWPELDNTFRAFVYDHQMVETSPALNAQHRIFAENTRVLVGLDRWPGGPTAPTSKDQRWRLRLAVWDIATESKNDLCQNNTEQMRKQIVRTAVARGFFSIWMTIFANDPDMKIRLINAFPGTATNCFDAQGNPLPRPGGAI